MIGANRSTVICRTLLALAVLATPFSSDAQQVRDRVEDSGNAQRIGLLAPRTRADAAQFVDAFRQGLRDLGWVEGKNIVIVYRWAEGSDERLASLAADLVRLKVDVILAANTQTAVAAKNATKTIPIVMGTAGDPVGVGLVESLAQPGGNVTGLSYGFGVGMLTKQLELLKQAIPTARRVAIFVNPVNPVHALWIKDDATKGATQSLGLQLQILEIRGPDAFDSAFAAIVRERADAVLVLADSLFGLHRKRLQDLVARNRLPAMYGSREYAEAGGLMSYGVDIRANFRSAATYVDKILKGAKAADLPIQQPTRFEFIINQKTGKALGLKIPHSILVRADEVIQ